MSLWGEGGKMKTMKQKDYRIANYYEVGESVVAIVRFGATKFWPPSFQMGVGRNFIEAFRALREIPLGTDKSNDDAFVWGMQSGLISLSSKWYRFDPFFDNPLL